MLRSVRTCVVAITTLIASIAASSIHAGEDEDISAEARAAVEVIRAATELGPDIYADVVKLLGQHPVVGWVSSNKAPRFTVLKLKNHDGSRMTDNFDAEPFSQGDRAVRFQLINVRPEHLDKVWWAVKSDVPGRADGNRLVDDNGKPGHGTTVQVERKADKDYAYYLAGRWDRGLSESTFFSENPNAALVIFLQ